MTGTTLAMLRSGRWNVGAIVCYCALAYAITWLAVSPLVAEALGIYGGSVPGWWHTLGALGPVGAAFLVARSTGDAADLRAWTTSLLRFRIPGPWWIVAVGSPLALLAVGLVAARVVTGQWTDGASVASGAGAASWWVGVALVSLAYGVGEEPGWRGFLLPGLMRRYSRRVATLLLAVIWAGWHTPFFFYRFDFAGPATVVGFFIAMLAGAYWMTFLYLGTGGSVPAVAAWHVVWNLVNFAAAEWSDLALGIMNGAVMVLGFGVLLLAGPGLGAHDLDAHPAASPAPRT